MFESDTRSLCIVMNSKPSSHADHDHQAKTKQQGREMLNDMLAMSDILVIFAASSKSIVCRAAATAAAGYVVMI